MPFSKGCEEFLELLYCIPVLAQLVMELVIPTIQCAWISTYKHGRRHGSVQASQWTWMGTRLGPAMFSKINVRQFYDKWYSTLQGQFTVVPTKITRGQGSWGRKKDEKAHEQESRQKQHVDMEYFYILLDFRVCSLPNKKLLFEDWVLFCFVLYFSVWIFPS